MCLLLAQLHQSSELEQLLNLDNVLMKDPTSPAGHLKSEAAPASPGNKGTLSSLQDLEISAPEINFPVSVSHPGDP